METSICASGSPVKEWTFRMRESRKQKLKGGVVAEDLMVELAGSGRVLRGRKLGRGPIRALFLHGWIDNVESFSLLEGVLGDKISAAIVDLPGHGYSDCFPKDMHDVTVADWIVDVTELCEALSDDPITLVGHSLGAGISALIGGLVPEKVKNLLLLDGLVPLPDSEETYMERARCFLDGRKMRLHKTVARSYDSIEPLVQARLRAGDLPEQVAERIVRRNVKMRKGMYVWGTDPRLKQVSLNRLTPGQLHSALRGIQCHVELVRATERTMGFDDAIFETFIPSIQDMTVHHFACGHYPHVDLPHDVARLVFRLCGTSSTDANGV